MHLHSNSDEQASSFQASGGFEVWVVQNLLQAGGQEGIYVLTVTNLGSKPVQAHNFFLDFGLRAGRLGQNLLWMGRLSQAWA